MFTGGASIPLQAAAGVVGEGAKRFVRNRRKNTLNAVIAKLDGEIQSIATERNSILKKAAKSVSAVEKNKYLKKARELSSRLAQIQGHRVAIQQEEQGIED